MDFLEMYYYGSFREAEGFERERAQRHAISLVLPSIMSEALTKQQELCLRYKYVYGKSQEEIAKLLAISQPTVSRHIENGKRKVNSLLKYCYASASAAINNYDKL